MLVKTILFLVIFASVFYLSNLFYPLLEERLRRWQKKRIEKIAPKLNDLFLDIPLKKLVLMDVGMPFLTGLLGYILTRNWVFALGFGLLGLVIPLVIVRSLEAKRRKKFAAQLVDGLMVLSSSLRAGLSLPQAFEALIEEMPTPISQEFSLVIRQVQMGVPLDSALYTLKKRMRMDDLDMMITAILVARETGGSLPDIFTQVARTIQERNKLIGRVNALCVQGRLQGIIMSVLPIFFGLFVYKTNPHFFDVLLKDSFGRFLLGYAFVSQILGMFLIRKFSKVDA
jgi:tight adherence protein B